MAAAKPSGGRSSGRSQQSHCLQSHCLQWGWQRLGRTGTTFRKLKLELIAKRRDLRRRTCGCGLIFQFRRGAACWARRSHYSLWLP